MVGDGRGLTVLEALQEELIATELFETGSPWLQLREVEATETTISGQFTISALNGDFTYRLTGWASWLHHVAIAELTQAPDGFVNPEPATTVAG